MNQLEKYLIVKGCAGLGNRLFTIAEAVFYAKQTNRELYVDWSDGQFGELDQNVFYNYFNLHSFHHYQNFPEALETENLSVYPVSYKDRLKEKIYAVFKYQNIPENTFLKKALSKVFLELNMGYWKLKTVHKNADGIFSYLKDINRAENLKMGSNLDPKINEDVVIFADFIPSSKEDSIVSEISLDPDFLEKIDFLDNKWELNNGMVGVHVRFSDKKPTKQLSELFTKINLLKDNYHLRGVFLATDNQVVLDAFQKEFDLVITVDKHIPVGSENEGLHRIDYNSENKGKEKLIMFEQSIMDMWLLSRCEYLLYQGNSSFSQISRILHSNSSKCVDWQE